MKMSDRSTGEFLANKKFILERKTLYSLESLNLVLKDIMYSGANQLYSTSDIMKDGGDNAFNNMQIALSDELVAISKQQVEEELSPVVVLVNGFKMGIETDPKYKVGTL